MLNQNPPKYRVLLIEDEESIAKPLTKLMTLRGYEVFWVENGDSALKWLNENPKVDCLFIDVMLPRMTGWEVRDLIKKQPQLSSIPAIFLSADSNSAREAGLRNEIFVAKPIDLTQLEKALLEAVKKDK